MRFFPTCSNQPHTGDDVQGFSLQREVPAYSPCLIFHPQPPPPPSTCDKGETGKKLTESVRIRIGSGSDVQEFPPATAAHFLTRDKGETGKKVWLPLFQNPVTTLFSRW